MDRDEIEKLLRLLADKLAQNDLIGEISIYGGAAMVLAYQSRLSTRDVDAVFAPQQEIYKAAADIAAEYEIEADWLNDAVKGFLSEKNETMPFLDLPGLKVFVACPEYLLAMKCLSMRLGKGDTDLNDVKFLMTHLGLHEANEVLDLLGRYYPENRIQPKTRFAIEEICQGIRNP